MKNDFWSVAIYDAGLVWGGREEGGWWYEAGEIALPHLARIFPTQAEARAYQEELREVVANLNKEEERRPMSSVLSTGEYVVMCWENELPPPGYPEARPFYE